MAEAGYPRDFYGYGRNPPDPRWPGDGRIAVQFVVNFEEGGKKQHSARRPRVGGVPARRVGRAAVAGTAPRQY